MRGEQTLSRTVTIVVLALVLVFATPVHFVAQTLLADEFTASALTAIVALAVFVFATLMSGLPRLEELRSLAGRDALQLVLAGCLGVFSTQYLVLSHRFTDAPPGAEVIFLTTAAWGVLAVIAGILTRRQPWGMQLTFALIALVGAAAVLANWERPSSFSPFVRYPEEGVAMVLAGAAWAAFGVSISRLAERYRWRVVLPVATAPSALLAVIVALATPGNVDVVQRAVSLWPLLLVLCATFTAMTVSWAWLSALIGVERAGALLFTTPVLLTVLAVAERRAAFVGPSPLLWEAAIWGSVATLVGATGVLLVGWARLTSGSPADETASASGGRPAALVALAAAVLGTLAGAVALAMPALAAQAIGSRSDGSAYEVAWTVPGIETVGTWLVFLVGVGLIIAALARADASWRAAAVVAVAVGLIVVLAAVPALVDTPLRTWTRWIPGEVQQDYGTEYASLTFADEPRTALLTSAVLDGASALVLLSVGAWAWISVKRRSEGVE